MAPDPTSTNVIEFVTIATTGNALDFGDAQVANYAEVPHQILQVGS